MKLTTCTTLALATLSVHAGMMPRQVKRSETLNNMEKRQSPYLPAAVSNMTTITSPTGVKIRYKQPGEQGVCETTPGVKSYTGYIELSPTLHSFFWFFESRENPSTDPVTLWLNGGPGSDSQIGLFQELGPCMIAKNLTSYINPYSWTNVSNFIFLSQPYGVGFSYQTEGVGSANNITGVYQNRTVAPADGRYPLVDAEKYDTTEIAAMSAWHVIQGFYSALGQLAPDVDSVDFNLWTESYGGHYGPAFFDYFYSQNELIGNGTLPGKHLNFNSLGIGNGIINEEIQVPYYPEMAVNNSYGISSYNDTVYTYTQYALYMPNGCMDQISFCNQADRTTDAGKAVCAEAANMCRDNVEGIYYNFGERGVYDIRHPYDDPTPPSYFEDYLNLPRVQQAIGVNLNYTTANNDIYYSFQQTGDFVYPDFLEDLSRILNSGVVVNLFYGDADYICNWYGGQAIANAVNYTHAEQFRKAGYVPLMVDGIERGEVKQYGNFTFTRVYEAGHEVPFYQPEAAFAIFNRTINHVNIADGTEMVTADYGTQGGANATHTESFVPLPSSTMMSMASGASMSGGTGGQSMTSAAASASGSAEAMRVPWTDDFA